MFIKHVSKKLSAYAGAELNLNESRAVAEHLISCLRCRSEFETVKFGAALAAQIPQAYAPSSIWPAIESALDRNPALLSARRHQLFNLPRASAFALASLALLVLIGFAAVLYFRKPSVVDSGGWNVARVAGAPRIGSSALQENGKLTLGQWLETDGSSRAKIELQDIGQVEIDPNTRVRLIETKATEHRLELERGRMSARISAPPKLFFVNTPSGVAEDLGCAYSLEVDDRGNSLLRVTAGWVSLQLKDRESVVPAGAACETRPGIGPGTPYFEDASESFRAALAKIDFASDSLTTIVPELNTVLHEARRRDAMSLWYLLFRVNREARARVYDRMIKLVPPPQGVTREGVLSLNQEMLNRWRESFDDDDHWFEDKLRDEYFRLRNSIRRRL